MTGSCNGTKVNDTDVFTFTLPRNGTVNIDLTFPSHDTDAAYSMSLFGSGGVSYSWSVKTSQGNGSTYAWKSSDYNLPAGTYYLSLSTSMYSVLNGEKYSLTVDATYPTYVETEDNGSAESADAIQLGTAIYGNCGADNHQIDEDYYRFKMDKAGSVTLSLTFPSHAAGETAYSAKLFDQGGVSYSWNIGTGVGEGADYTWKSSEFNLPAGTYYFKLTTSLWDGLYNYKKTYGERYALRVDASYSDQIETEGNGSKDVANPVKIGKVIVGNTGCPGVNNDTDYFSFDLVEQSDVSLTIVFPSHAGGGTACRLQIEGEKKTYESWMVKTGYGDGVSSSYTTNAVTLPAGRYYVSIQANASAANFQDRYSLTIDDGMHGPNLGFRDVANNDWYVKDGSLSYVVENGLMGGYGDHLFGPYNSITRGQVATILWRMDGKRMLGSRSFDDVDYSQYYGNAIRWARATGVINGYGDSNTFAPEKAVTREELAKMLSNYAAKIAGEDTNCSYRKMNSMPDAGSVSPWAKPAMAWAIDRGLITGVKSGGNAYIDPTSTAQRCAMAKMIRVLDSEVLGGR